MELLYILQIIHMLHLQVFFVCTIDCFKWAVVKNSANSYQLSRSSLIVMKVITLYIQFIANDHQVRHFINQIHYLLKPLIYLKLS